MLEVNHIKKSFKETEVLTDISFSMEKGQVLSIIGSSGSGKTTLLRCLNFLERPDEGTILVNGETLFDGKDLNKHSESENRKKRLHFGLVFQQFNLFPQYTVKENVTLAPRLNAEDTRSIEEIDALADKLLDQMGLSEKKNLYPHQLSGGQQQRVAIARALALSPDILCFDEPTSALDPELTGEVLKVIRELADKHTTMIIVTHEMDFARDVSDYVIFMDKGVIVEQGDAVSVINNPQMERTKAFLSGHSMSMPHDN
ncbi:MAG: amino acid ABC transporter ATP-binding protein [Butyrivibrio sp.]|nr:amino acid ABC transporter ATP-binding protein [Butyrivibrio sp.]